MEPLLFEEFTLAASTADLGEEPAARADADAVEFRLDLAQSGSKALAEYDGQLPLLVTNRVEWEGGESPDTDARIETLCEAVEHSHVRAVDVELAAIKECQPVIERARENDVTVVVSTHDFETTPPRDELGSLLNRACTHGDVGKLAVTPHSRGDVLSLLDVTYAQTEAGNTVATMAMGEAGRHSRAVAPLYGSRIGYAPIEPANATAPGQYSLETLRSLVAALRSADG
jgi:3-dehydroquinate dehydratase-1